MEAQTRPAGAVLLAPPTVTVPGKLDLTVRRRSRATPKRRATSCSRAAPSGCGSRTGSASARRRSRPRSGRAAAASAATRPRQGRHARVARYRYPESRRVRLSTSSRARARLPGHAHPAAANFGVVVLRGAGVRSSRASSRAGDEHRLIGYAALPINLNPYLRTFGEPCSPPARSCPRPARTTSSSTAPRPRAPGAFMFRFWVNDVTPPTAGAADAEREARRRERRRGAIRPRLRRRPESVVVRMDGTARSAASRRRGPRSRSPGSRAGRTGSPPGVRLPGDAEQRERRRILPNTRVLRTTFTVR